LLYNSTLETAGTGAAADIQQRRSSLSYLLIFSLLLKSFLYTVVYIGAYKFFLTIVITICYKTLSRQFIALYDSVKNIYVRCKMAAANIFWRG